MGSKSLPRLKHAILHLVGVNSSSINSLLMADLDGLFSTASCRSIRLKLSFDTSVHCSEEIRCSIDRLADSQDTMVLKDDSFLVSECFGDPATFFMGKDDASKVVVDGMVFVESIRSSVS